jgi:hypothetical protein
VTTTDHRQAYTCMIVFIYSNEWSTVFDTPPKYEPAPAPLCPPQIPLDQTRDRTRAAAVGSQRLTAWALARPFLWPWSV